jgi:ribosomal subunit interface protein
MEVLVHGKQLDVGDALRGHVESALKAHVEKYFSRAINANTTFGRAGKGGVRADIAVHPRRGLVVQGSAEAGDAYAAFDVALARIDKQLRRYKRRLNDRHKERAEDEILGAQQYVIAPESAEEAAAEESPPVIVAEMPHDIATLTVGEAVMRLDLAEAPVVMFRNRGNGAFNVVYRRPDGNIGWIDPSAATRG